ncbi:serine/threonine-protein kinase [Ruania zhangjianzhongii]|uniref:serine/threonine-protein kinase n=1 Tax=Ruania zhangjianzhongii TaxID=2603206 RepID=UPI0011CB7FD5|nr:serine/threonine-protein kinase [Ruania zhangjianzhongii]
MSRRRPSRPPEIPGFQHERLLGSGGFADVFLYEQELPRRKVAVKALLADAVTPDGLTQFVGEANLMAQLSTHPSIVTIYQAATTEDGRPYLVMEYCPRPNLSVRYRNERIGVAEALRIAARLAGAVETAHRAGILHRDIKPANVLTTDYGWPALTDFGISVATAAADDSDQAGMSIPWAAPEFFADDAPRGVGADVYALTATIYTLLARRSPFEAAGGSNSALDLITRIEREPVPPTGRDDVPESLEEVFRRGMAKDPAQRFPSAAAFARAIQRVETELHLTPTPLDVPDTSWAHGTGGGESGEDQRTRVRSVSTIDVNPDGTRHRPAIIDPAAARSPRNQPGGRETAVRPEIGAAAGVEETAKPPPPRRRTTLIAAGAALVVVAAVTAMAIGALNQPDGGEGETTTAPVTIPPDDPSTEVELPPAPQNATAERDGDTVEVSWDAPEFDNELEFYYVATSGGERWEENVGSRTSDTLEARPEQVCVQIWSIDATNRNLSSNNESPTVCA